MNSFSGNGISSKMDPVFMGGSNFRGMLTKVALTKEKRINGYPYINTVDLRVTTTNKKVIKTALERLSKEDQELSRIVFAKGKLVYFEGRNVTSRFIKKLYEVEKELGIKTELSSEYEDIGYAKYKLGGVITPEEAYRNNIGKIKSFDTTIEAYERNYGTGHIGIDGENLWDFAADELETGAVEIKQIWYAKIGDRYYETDIEGSVRINKLNEVWN